MGGRPAVHFADFAHPTVDLASPSRLTVETVDARGKCVWRMAGRPLSLAGRPRVLLWFAACLFPWIVLSPVVFRPLDALDTWLDGRIYFALCFFACRINFVSFGHRRVVGRPSRVVG